MLEKKIEKTVCDYAKLKGFAVFKFVSANNRGVPDRIFIKDKKVFFIEFKAKGKKTSSLQDVQIKKIMEQGIDCFVVDDIQKGKDIIDVNT